MISLVSTGGLAPNEVGAVRHCSCGNPQGLLGGAAPFFIDGDGPPVSEPGCPLICLSVEGIIPDDVGAQCRLSSSFTFSRHLELRFRSRFSVPTCFRHFPAGALWGAPPPLLAGVHVLSKWLLCLTRSYVNPAPLNCFQSSFCGCWEATESCFLT